jgi:hypothetical protein
MRRVPPVSSYPAFLSGRFRYGTRGIGLSPRQLYSMWKIPFQVLQIAFHEEKKLLKKSSLKSYYQIHRRDLDPDLDLQLEKNTDLDPH